MKAHYLEAYAPGQVYGGATRIVVDAASIKRFAAEFDPQPFHLDEAAAESTFFRGLAASGWHTAAVLMRLLVDSELRSAGGIVKLRFTALNRRGEPVQAMVGNPVVPRRPG